MFEVLTNHNYYYQCCETACHYNIKIPSVQITFCKINLKHNNPGHYTFYLIHKPLCLPSGICIDFYDTSTPYKQKRIILTNMKGKRKVLFLLFFLQKKTKYYYNVGIEIIRNSNITTLQHLSGLASPLWPQYKVESQKSLCNLYSIPVAGKNPLIASLKYTAQPQVSLANILILSFTW